MRDTPARIAMTLLALIMAAVLPGLVHAQTPVWNRIGDAANPPGFDTHSAVYDSVGDRLLTYIGYGVLNGSAYPSTGIWEYRLSEPDSGWRQVITSGNAPSGLANVSLVGDAVNSRMFLFGGFPAYSGTITNDLYELFHVGTPTWFTVPASKDTLRARLNAFMCLDEATHSLVLYGGRAFFGDHYGEVFDLWTLPLDGPPVWSRVPVASPLPPEREGAQIAWDGARRRILVHGGLNPAHTAVLTDTWALSLGDTARWQALAASGPQIARADGGALVDPAADRLLLLPGNSYTYPASSEDQRVYQLPLGGGGEWSPAPGFSPFGQSAYNYATARDSRRNRALTIWSTLLQAFALTDTSGWSRLWPPDPVREPGALTGHVLVADAARQVIWSVGGEEPSGFNGLWKLDASGQAQWNWYPQSPPLPLSGGHAAALDTSGARILVAACDPSCQIEELTLSGTPTELVWAPRDTFPHSRVDHTVVVDPVRRRLLLFGGQFFYAHFTGYSLSDLWSVPLDSLSAWTPLAPAGPIPSPRGGHFAFYDDLQDRMVMFGGWQQGGGPIRHYQHDAWALSLTGTPAWTQLNGPYWDPPVSGHITYDAVNHRLFLFHASREGTPNATQVFMRGIADGDAWQILSTASTPVTSTAPVAYAPWADRLVVVGTQSDGPNADETWALQIDHAVPALASLESIEASPDRVRITWQLGSATPMVALARRADDGPWRPLATLSPDGDGRLSYEDRDIAPGAHLRYRLSEGARTLLETDVTVPDRAALAFAGARPSPARGGANLAFTLPAPSRVTLELYDLRGARVLSREWPRLDAGEHAFAWRETAVLAPGLYLARLVTGYGTREAKLVLLR